MFADDPVAGWEFFCVIVSVIMVIGGYVGYRLWKAGDLDGLFGGGGY
jgi:hypothetical protein